LISTILEGTAMPDFCMCPGDECPIKNQCYRYRAVQDLAQSYFRDIPYNFVKNGCKGFKVINETSAQIRQLNDQSWNIIIANDRKKLSENK
jgi:hypothetical protein